MPLLLARICRPLSRPIFSNNTSTPTVSGVSFPPSFPTAERVAAVAKVMGPDETENTLVPFILESVDDEDEVLYTLAASLGKIGGSVHKAQVLLEPLERLCAVESEGVEGVICGRSIYTGALDFAAAQKRADELMAES